MKEQDEDAADAHGEQLVAGPDALTTTVALGAITAAPGAWVVSGGR